MHNHKARGSFGSALQTAQLRPYVQQFNLPEEVIFAAAQGNLEAFAKAKDSQARAKQEKKPLPHDDDSQMDT